MRDTCVHDWSMIYRQCPVCGQRIAVVNHAVEKRANGTTAEVGYLGGHWRPGIPATSKCRGSFGTWVGKA